MKISTFSILRCFFLFYIVVSKIDGSKKLNLLTATITDLKQALLNCDITTTGLVQQYLNRIDQVNLKGPALHAVIEKNPDVLAIANELEQRDNLKGQLHGIPILIKDNIATADKMNTTAGSLALLGARVQNDAFVVNQLRAAGAIVLGKTSLSEWSGFRSLRATRNGVSARGGVSKSAYITDGDPLGSSSGSAIAVSVGLCSVALGTETDGSIVAPASRNAIVGIKPTVGLTSRHNVIPISSRQDSVGVLGRTVSDVATVLEVIQGVDQQDDRTRSCGTQVYNQFLRGTKGFKGVRLGVIRSEIISSDLEEEMWTALNESIILMRQNGAFIQDPVKLINESDILVGSVEFTLLISEFKQNIQRYLKTLRNTKIQTLQDIIDFNIAHPDEEFSSYFPDQDLFLLSQNATKVTRQLENEYIHLSRSLHETLNNNNLDAIFTISEYTASPAAIAGSPIISVPLGFYNTTEGQQPFGISFMGRACSEATLFQLAHAFEQMTHVRDKVRPQYAPK